MRNWDIIRSLETYFRRLGYFVSLLNILTFPHPGLKVKAEPIEDINDEIRQLAENMIDTMYHFDGVGLAATQVSRAIRMFVMDVSTDASQAKILINPEITDKDGSAVANEGCLSFPHAFAKVKRAEKITCTYLDLQGKQCVEEVEGLAARCIQHELDHLEGITFYDYLSPLKQSLLRKKVKKALKETT